MSPVTSRLVLVINYTSQNRRGHYFTSYIPVLVSNKGYSPCKLQKQRMNEKSSLIFFLRRNPTKNSDFKIEIVNTTKPKHDARPSVWKLEGTRTPLLRYIVSIIRWSTQQLIRCECDRQKHGAWTMELASGARDVEVEWSKHVRLALPCLPACLPIAHPKSTRRTRAARTSPLASDSHIMAHSGAHACLACAISSARVI